MFKGPPCRHWDNLKPNLAFSLNGTAKFNGVDLQAWLTDVLIRIADHNINRIDELLPRNYRSD